MRRFLSMAALALSLSAILSAYPAGFAGSAGVGGSGTDAFGHTWRVHSNSWGIPGLFDGVASFLGPNSATDLHATFWDDAGAIDINPFPLPTSPFGSDDSTRFSNISDAALWTRMIAGNHVDFFAGPSLETGEDFFVNVVFVRDIVGTLRFEAAWTGTNPVPEPSSLALMGLGVAGLAAVARRRMSR